MKSIIAALAHETSRGHSDQVFTERVKTGA